MGPGTPNFESTLWSQIILAAREPDSNDGRMALARLCSIYWYPVYAFIRRRAQSPADAQDLTQGFFEHILAKGFLVRADASRGRFRNYLLGAVKNYLGTERERRATQRRGGGAETLSIDSILGEQWLSVEPSAENDPTKAFDRSWASTVISGAIQRLDAEQVQLGKTSQFAELKQFLQRSAKPGEYEAVAAKLQLTKSGVAVTVHRLTERFGELARSLVRETISDPEMAEDELRFLYSALHD